RSFFFPAASTSVSGRGRCRRTPRLLCAGRSLALAALGCRMFLFYSQGRSTCATKFCVGRILTLTTRTAILEGTPTVVTKLHPCGILKATAWAAHMSSLLLRACQGKETSAP